MCCAVRRLLPNEKTAKRTKRKTTAVKGSTRFAAVLLLFVCRECEAVLSPASHSRTKKSSFGDIKTFPVRTVENAVVPRNVFQKFLEGVP